MARVDEMTRGIYRISTMVGEAGLQFNQFLIDDERPVLIHTGMFPMYESVREAVAEVLDPKRLAYVVCPHFESDECGGIWGGSSPRPPRRCWRVARWGRCST